MYPTAKCPITPSWSGVFESADSVADATTGVGAELEVDAEVVALTVVGGGGGGGVDTVADPSAVWANAF
jgi:hypothetical protein